MVEILFYIFAAVMIGGAFGVVLSRSPVGSLLFMVTTLASLAGVYVLLEAHFLAAAQVIVYAGAILVLFLFVIMLLNLGHDYRKDLKGGVSAVISFVIIGALAGFVAHQVHGAGAGTTAVMAPGARSIDLALERYGAVGAIARPLFTTYVVPFEITGILLLVAIVGALVLAKRRVS